MAQLLIDEALDLKLRALAREASRSPEEREADELMARHQELLELRKRMGG